MASKEELRDVVREEVTGWLEGLNGKISDNITPAVTDIKATTNGLNEKIGWVLASLERDGALEVEQMRVLAGIASALPAAGGAVDVAAFAAAVRNGLGDEVASAIAQRLAP